MSFLWEEHKGVAKCALHCEGSPAWADCLAVPDFLFVAKACGKPPSLTHPSLASFSVFNLQNMKSNSTLDTEERGDVQVHQSNPSANILKWRNKPQLNKRWLLFLLNSWQSRVGSSWFFFFLSDELWYYWHNIYKLRIDDVMILIHVYVAKWLPQ